MLKRDKDDLYRPIAASLLYPKEEKVLRERVSRAVEQFSTDSKRVLVTPHGAYDSTLSLLASTYSQAVEGEFKRVIVIAPVHREFSECLWLPQRSRFETPLGELKIDLDAIEKVVESPLFSKSDMPFFEESSIETQLPFIASLFPSLPVLPLFLGANTISLAKEVETLLNLFANDSLTIITANLSPFVSCKRASALADRAIKVLEGGSHTLLRREQEEGRIALCGSCAFEGVLRWLGGRFYVTERGYSSESRGSVVAYGGMVWDRY